MAVHPFASFIDASVQLQNAARDLLDAFGGDTPDWLRTEAARLQNAYDRLREIKLPADPYSTTKEA